jgi:hypothetical protein
MCFVVIKSFACLDVSVSLKYARYSYAVFPQRYNIQLRGCKNVRGGHLHDPVPEAVQEQTLEKRLGWAIVLILFDSVRDGNAFCLLLPSTTQCQHSVSTVSVLYQYSVTFVFLQCQYWCQCSILYDFVLLPFASSYQAQ